MPVRTSTYSPAFASSSTRFSSTTNLSSVGSPSSLSIGHYKPITSTNYVSPSSSSYSSPSRYSSNHHVSPSSWSSTLSTNRYSPHSTSSSSSSSYSSSYLNRVPSLSSSSSSSTSSSSSASSSSSSYLLSSSTTPTPTPTPMSRLTSTSSSTYRPRTTNEQFSAHSKYSRPLSSIRQSSISGIAGVTGRHQSSSIDEHQQQEAPPSGLAKGLTNLGNTCYMNAVIQALYSVESFRHLVLRSCGSAVCNELRNLFSSMSTSSSSSSRRLSSASLSHQYHTSRSSHDSSVSPVEFRREFGRAHARHKSFAGFGQHDAQEFLRYLVSACHDELNTVKPCHGSAPVAPPSDASDAWRLYRRRVDNSDLVDVFVGQLRSTIECGECSNKSNCWDPFWDLALSLGDSSSSSSLSSSYTRVSSVSSALSLFCAHETLDHNERPQCERCKRATRATKSISIERAPQVLVLQMKKFTNDGYKLHSCTLNVERELQLTHTTNNQTFDYSLQACISHHGFSATSGHYTCTARYANNRWFHFNDTSVHEINNGSSEMELRDAYVLFYVLRTDTSPISSRL